jgi:uncharacterized protein (DUF305 family)
MRLICALALFAALGVSACGSGDDASSGPPAGGNGIDRAFVEAMIPHHESAIEMAEIAQDRAKSEFVKSLAQNIIRAQAAEIETLRAEDARLADAGVKAGNLGISEHHMGMSMDVSSLETAEPFDTAFLNMMIPHHEGAVKMAEIEMEQGSNARLIDLAEQIIAAQESEMEAMQAQLSGKAPAMSEPEGGAPTDSESEHGAGHDE